MVDLAGFGDFLRGALKDLEGGATDIIKPLEKAGEDVAGAFSGIARDIEGGAGEIVKPVERVGEDLSGALSSVREDLGDVGSGIKRDFSSFGDFLRRNKLGLAIGAGVGLAGGLGAYEYLKSRGNYNDELAGGYNSQASGYNSQLGGAYGDAGGYSALGGYSGAVGETGLGTGLQEGSLPNSGIFSNPLVWIIIAVVIIMIIIVIVMYRKKG